MTHNQIEYQKLQETKRYNIVEQGRKERELGEQTRHNLSTEKETYRHNLRSEQLSRDNLNESIRHNSVVEIESNRHNVATERQASKQLSETIRSNMAGERLTAYNLQETNRHNVAMESVSQGNLEVSRVLANETITHNRNTEAIQKSQVGLGYAQLQETTRHNTAVENETRRANVAKQTADNTYKFNTLAETKRVNIVNQGVKQEELNLKKAQLEIEKRRAQTYVDTEYLKAFTNLAGASVGLMGGLK